MVICDAKIGKERTQLYDLRRCTGNRDNSGQVCVAPAHCYKQGKAIYLYASYIAGLAKTGPTYAPDGAADSATDFWFKLGLVGEIWRV